MSETYSKDPPSKARRFPKRLLNHAGGGNHRGKIAEFEEDDMARARPMPSLPRIAWLERPDPDDQRKPSRRPERRS
jgi:hypothetical protein